MPLARNGGVRLSYELLGDPDAPALVLSRGLARSRSYWLGIAERFAEHFRVLVMDNRGIGRSDSPAPPYSTATMADDVACTMAHAGIERAHFFGMSLGGMIGQWLAVRHAGRIDRLVLGCTTPGGRVSTPVPLDAAWALALCAGKPLDDALLRTACYTLAPTFVATRPDVLERWVEIARSEPHTQRGIIGQALAGALHDASGQLRRIHAPTLIITGDADRLIPPRNSYALVERIPNARLRVLPGVGHDFPTERPEKTLDLVSSFLLGSPVHRGSVDARKHLRAIGSSPQLNAPTSR